MGNQLMLVALPVGQVAALMEISECEHPPEIKIDIENLQVHCDDLPLMRFDISKRHQEMFLRGVDVVGMSLTYLDEIKEFANAHWEDQPWLKDVAARMRAAA